MNVFCASCGLKTIGPAVSGKCLPYYVRCFVFCAIASYLPLQSLHKISLANRFHPKIRAQNLLMRQTAKALCNFVRVSEGK